MVHNRQTVLEEFCFISDSLFSRSASSHRLSLAMPFLFFTHLFIGLSDTFFVLKLIYLYNIRVIIYSHQIDFPVNWREASKDQFEYIVMVELE